MATVRHYLVEQLRERRRRRFRNLTDEIGRDTRTMKFYVRNSLHGCEQWYIVGNRLREMKEELRKMFLDYPSEKGGKIDIRC